MGRILFSMDSQYHASCDDDPPCMYDFSIKTLRWFTVRTLQNIVHKNFAIIFR